MSLPTKEMVLRALAGVIDPDSGADVVSAGLVSGLALREGKAGFLITIDPKDKERKAWLRDACEAAVAAVPGVSAVTAVLTAQHQEPIPPKPEAGYAGTRERAVWNITPVEGVSRVIAIGSGKGGVGKSTTAVNLALALTRLGQRVGLLDADIYGPSIPRMMKLKGQPEIVDGKMAPPVSHGVSCMSMGLITGENAAILRGPMISKTLHQLLRSSRWGALDMLLIDLPPGTGDIHLSLAQQVKLDGAIIVTTPQEVATIDAQKCLQMFRKLGSPVLGVIENMSWFADPATGAKHAIFGEGGGRRLAEHNDAPFLGALPIDMRIREAADAGESYFSSKDALYRKAYLTIAKALL